MPTDPHTPAARALWALDPQVTHLNHGGFGAAPRAVLAEQSRRRAELEANPTAFFLRRLPALLSAARESLAGYLGAAPAGLVFVSNATAGVATVLAGAPLQAGDEVLATDHGYGAVAAQLRQLARTRGVHVRTVRLGLPVRSATDIVQAVLAGITPRTRLCVLDHVSSPTAVVFPVAALVAACHDRGVAVCLDGAHAPGQLPLALDELDADYYVGNLHKWVCAPKSAAVLWVAAAHRMRLRPLVASHGFEEGIPAAFDWTGTRDPTALLAAGTAIETIEAEFGWQRCRAANESLARAGAQAVAARLAGGVPASGAPARLDPTSAGSGPAGPVAEALTASMRLVDLGCDLTDGQARELEAELAERHRIEVPVTGLGNTFRFLRLSAHAYNSLADYHRLAEVLPAALAEVLARSGPRARARTDRHEDRRPAS